DRAVHVEAGNEIVHPVQAADEGALAAARGADHGRDEVLVHLHRHALERRLGTVDRVELFDLENGFQLLARRHRLTLRLDAHGLLDRTRRGHGFSPRLVHPAARSSLRRLRVASHRAPRLAMRMKVIRTSAAAHASAWLASSGWSKSSKIATGTDWRGWDGFQ